MKVAHAVLSIAMLAMMTSAAERAESADRYPPAWPRVGSTTLVENDRGAAYEVTYLTDRASPMHQHHYPFAGLDLETASIRVTEPDGTTHVFADVKNNMWFLPRGVPHSEMSITSPPRHIVAIDIKDQSVPPAENTTGLPNDAFADYQKKVLDNDRVTIWDVAWAPGVQSKPSFNTRDMFLAFAEGGDLSIGTHELPAHVINYKSGQAIFLAGGTVRTFAAVRGTVHVMLVQVK